MPFKTEEARRKFGKWSSTSMKKLWQNPKYRKHMSETHKGYIMPKEQRKKIGESLKKTNPKHWKRKRKNVWGYVLLYKPDHPFCDSTGYIFEHRLIMEEYLGRYLKRKEHLHHINNIPDDNRIENFILFKNFGYHMVFHRWNYYNPKGIIFDGRKI